MKEYEFHPLAEAYPLLDGHDFEDLCSDIQANGLDKPIVLYEDKILDGRNRYRACLKVKVKPKFEQYQGDDPLGYVETQNDFRRHESLETTQRRRADRVVRVAEKRRSGKSLREISSEENVSPEQVRQDLQAATVKGLTVEPEGGKVEGRDGRKRTANPKRTPVAEREPGEDDGAFDDKDAERERKRREANKPKPASKDAIGQTIPGCQKDAFGDPILPETIAWLQEAQAEAERIVERLKRKITHYPFVLVKDAYQHLDEAVVALQCARESLAAGVPHVVCPRCKGKGCKECRNGGHFPSWRFEELREQEAMS